MKVSLRVIDEDSFLLGYQDGKFCEAMHISHSWDMRADVAAGIVAMREWSQEKDYLPRARARHL